MTTKFPAEIDQFENPAPDTSQATARTHSQQHGDANDAVEAVQRKLGVDGSEDPGSIDYKLRAISGVTDSLGTAAFQETSAFATSAQGALAESATQPADLNEATAGLQQQITGLINGQQTQAIYADTLAALQAITGTYEGQGAFVMNGTGAGTYRWSVSGAAWQFLRADTVGALTSEVKPPIAQVNPLTDAVRSGLYAGINPRVATSLVAASVGYSSWSQAFDVGTDVTAGTTFDGIHAQLQTSSGTDHINVAVWRRLLSSTAQDRAGPGLAGDVLLARKNVHVSDLNLLEGLATNVWLPLPVTVAEVGYTYLVTVDARNSSDASVALGMGYFAVTGYSQRRMGYYLSTPNAGFWSNLGAGTALAMNLGTAQYVSSAKLDNRTSSLEDFESAINRALPRSPQSVATIPADSEFNLATGRYSWAIGVVGGLDVAAGIESDGVTVPLIVDEGTVRVLVQLYSRPRGAAWESQPPGATGDVLLGSLLASVDDLGLVPGATVMQPVNFGLPRFAVAANTMYYLLVEAQDGAGNRLLSAITYQSVTGLVTDQYRKFWRSGPTSSWSNGVTSVTFRLGYNFTLTGYDVPDLSSQVPVRLGDAIESASARWQGSSLLVTVEATRSGGRRTVDATVSPAALSSGTVVDEALTLRPAAGAAKTWSYLTDRVAHAVLGNVVVKDAATSAVLVRDTDFWSIPALGCFSLPGTSGAFRNVLVGYTWKARRYDVVVYTPLTGAVSVITGTERVRDASEFVPTPAAGQIALFVIDVAARTIIPVWDNAPAGVKRRSVQELTDEQIRSRSILRPVLGKLRRGAPLSLVAYGDSNFAQMGGAYSLAAVRSTANTVFHDRTKDVNGLLQDPPYGADVLATIPLFDTGDGAGTVHTRFGLIWELIRAMQAGFGSTVNYRNRSIPGTTSANATYQGLDSVRLAAAVADVSAGDLVIVGFGQNEMGQATTRANVISICQAFQAVGAVVLVMGCYRPNANDLNSTHTYSAWKYTQRALREAAYACGAAYVSTELLYDDAVAGVLGLSPNDYSAATFDVHPGLREHRLLGAQLASLLE